MTMNRDTALSDDLLTGAKNIAYFMYGNARKCRRVYYLAERQEIPVFWLGGMMHARKSVLMASIAAKERNSTSALSLKIDSSTST